MHWKRLKWFLCAIEWNIWTGTQLRQTNDKQWKNGKEKKKRKKFYMRNSINRENVFECGLYGRLYGSDWCQDECERVCIESKMSEIQSKVKLCWIQFFNDFSLVTKNENLRRILEKMSLVYGLCQWVLILILFIELRTNNVFIWKTGEPKWKPVIFTNWFDQLSINAITNLITAFLCYLKKNIPFYDHFQFQR